MPWISLHIAIPVILLSGWWIGRLLEMGRRFNLAWGAALVAVAILFVCTMRTSYLVNYVNYDDTTEYIDYAHGAPGVNWTMQDIATIAQKAGAGQNLKIAYAAGFMWPIRGTGESPYLTCKDSSCTAGRFRPGPAFLWIISLTWQ